MSVCLKDIDAVVKHDIFSDMNNIRNGNGIKKSAFSCFLDKRKAVVFENFYNSFRLLVFIRSFERQKGQKVAKCFRKGKQDRRTVKLIKVMFGQTELEMMRQVLKCEEEGRTQRQRNTFRTILTGLNLNCRRTDNKRKPS